MKYIGWLNTQSDGNVTKLNMQKYAYAQQMQLIIYYSPKTSL